MLVLKASNSNEIDAAFAALVQQQAGALLITTDVFYLSRTDQIVALAARHAVPTAVLRQPRQCGEDVLRMFVTGGPPAPHAKRIDAASSLESTPARRR